MSVKLFLRKKQRKYLKINKRSLSREIQSRPVSGLQTVPRNFKSDGWSGNRFSRCIYQLNIWLLWSSCSFVNRITNGKEVCRFGHWQLGTLCKVRWTSKSYGFKLTMVTYNSLPFEMLRRNYVNSLQANNRAQKKHQVQ